MKWISFSILLVIVAGCSKYLKVEILNLTASSIGICSLDGKYKNCVEIDPEEKGVLPWGSGEFEAVRAGVTFKYSAQIPEPIELYKNSYDEPLAVAVLEDMKVVVLAKNANGEIFERLKQPSGYPVVPHP